MDNGTYTKWRNATLDAKLETDKKYMILKMGSYLTATAGLGWYILYTLNGIRFAIENKYIPVVDWKNCKLPLYDASKAGKENVWEYFFEQPCHVGLETAYESGDFFVVDDVRKIGFKYSLNYEDMVDFQNERMEAWRNIFQRYVRLKKEWKEYFDDHIASQKLEIKELIGVLVRGTDYRELKPVSHPCAVSAEEVFSEIDSLINRKNSGKIFLATEDQSVFDAFKEKYPGKVYFADAKRYDHLGSNTLNAVNRGENGYERDLKYLYSLYVVSRASACIYSACGGGALASLMREGTGDSYTFLYHGCNRPKGIVVGSFLEKVQEKMLFLGNKPILFYALNTLELLKIEKVDVILSEKLKEEYQDIIGSGENFGIQINYVISDNYDVVEYMLHNPDFMPTSKLVLLYADYFSHGAGLVAELYNKAEAFDGAYIWGTKKLEIKMNESILLDTESRMPQKAFPFYEPKSYSLMGKFVFDHDLAEIVRQIADKKERVTLTDVLNEYINRRKLFFLEYSRGVIASKIEDMETLEKTDQMICLIEEIQRQKIGDFESFRKKD